jgi:hypothetical protein
MTETVNQLTRIIAAVELQDIRLLEASAKAMVREPQEVGPVIASFEWGARLLARAGETFFVAADMRATVSAKDPPEKRALEVHAVFELKYRLDPALGATDEELDKFAAVNGSFNAWPYGREFIESVSVRMHLPPLIAPLFRLSDAVGTAHVDAENTKAPRRKRVARRRAAVSS